MPLPPSSHPYTVVLWWPYRAAIAPVTVQFQSAVTKERPTTVSLGYSPVLNIAGEAFSAMAWTKIQIDSEYPFAKDYTEFRGWLKTHNGRRQLTDTALACQNTLIDHLKAEFPYNENIAHIRYFGAAEWPYILVSTRNNVQWERANPSLLSTIASTPLEPKLASLAAGHELSTTARMIARAATLVECGYPTEGLLVSVAILDAVTQKVLVEGMVTLGVGQQEAIAQLRNVTQQRFKTYLDSLLKIVVGHSLSQDEPQLFAKVLDINRTRNDVIHHGNEVPRSEAREAVQSIHDVLDYLNRVTTASIDAGPRPSFCPE